MSDSVSACEHIAFERFGSLDSPQLVLIHSLALDKSVWQRMVPELAEHFSIWAIDLPGHGKSKYIVRPTIEAMANCVAEMLKAQNVGSYTVVGMSMGGCVAQALAIHYPDQIEGLCILDSTSWYGPDAKTVWEQRAQRAVNEGLATFADFQLSRWFTPEFLATSPEVASTLFDIFVENDVPAYVAACRSMGRFDARLHLGDITCPTMIGVGSEDQATPIAASQFIADHVPDAEFEILDGCAHLSAIERPVEVAHLIKRLHARIQS